MAKYLDNTGLAHFWDKIKDKFAAKSHTHSTQDLKRPSGLRGLNDVTLQALVNTTRANRLAFLPADQIIIEQTTDGGNTWVSANVSDADKVALFSETRVNIYIPRINNARSTLCGLRVTFTAMKYNVPDGTAETDKYSYWNSSNVVKAERYCQLKEFYFWLSSVSDTIGVKVERATGANPNNWYTIFDDSSFYMNGWSGCDYINFFQNTFGGNITQTGNMWNYRITFMTKGVNGTDTMATTSTTSAQVIQEIRGYGDTVWVKPNEYMANDKLYTHDRDRNAFFPAQITATQFNGTATNASKVNNHTVNKDVPANAVFTDTTYSVATQSADGLMSAADKTKLDNMSGGGGGSIETPVSVANGGTGATTAAQARENLLLGAFYGAEILYENWSNEPSYGTTISKPCTDYKLLIVVCKDNDGTIVQPAIVPSPTIGSTFNVLSVYPGAANGAFYFKATTFKFADATTIEWSKDGNNWQTGEMGVSNSGNTWNYIFRHAPVFIIGLKL